MSTAEIKALAQGSKIPLEMRMAKAIQRADLRVPRKPNEERKCAVEGGTGDGRILVVRSDDVEVARYTYGELAG